MTKIASVAEVQEAGVTIQAEEAVASAQQLIETLQRGADDPLRVGADVHQQQKAAQSVRTGGNLPVMADRSTRRSPLNNGLSATSSHTDSMSIGQRRWNSK